MKKFTIYQKAGKFKELILSTKSYTLFFYLYLQLYAAREESLWIMPPWSEP